MVHQSIPKLFFSQSRKFSSRVFLRGKHHGQYRDCSWTAVADQIRALSSALRNQGIKKSDCVGILSENRPEWAVADLAILSLGAVTVPVYATSTPAEIQYILKHCKARTLFISTRDQMEKVSGIRGELSDLSCIIQFDLERSSNGVLPFAEFITLGHEPPSQLEQSIDSINPDDLASIIYTSGTTGPPKGVMLTHKNFLSNCEACKTYIPAGPEDVTLSFLPLSHVFERMAGYYYALMNGATICYAEKMDTVPENLQEVHPTICCSVPRFFEKMQAKIMDQVAASPALRKKLFFWAKSVGERVSRRMRSRESIPPVLLLQHGLASLLVYKKIQKKLGGRLRFFISGGAPLSKDLAEFFHAFGVLILEGYGLTETSPVISCNSTTAFKFGSVGKIIPGLEVRIASDGEILVRGDCVMRGYFENEAATREVIQDGWFKTGDIGRIDEEGFLFITDRKKDIIVTAGGKNVSPQNIERALVSDRLISQVCVFGDRKPFLTALIVPNWEEVTARASQMGLKESSKRELSESDSVKDIFRKRIDELMVDYPPYSTIKYFCLLTDEFTQPSGELTPTLKLKRKVIAQKYGAQLEKMYAVIR